MGTDKSAMTEAQKYHLRKLLAWLRCEMGPEGKELVSLYQDISDKLDNPSISKDAEVRLVDSYLKAESFPKYIRHSIKMLQKYSDANPESAQPEPSPADNPFLVRGGLYPEEGVEEFQVPWPLGAK